MIGLLCFICLFVFSVTTHKRLGLKCSNFWGFDGAHPGDVIMKFGEDWFVH